MKWPYRKCNIPHPSFMDVQFCQSFCDHDPPFNDHDPHEFFTEGKSWTRIINGNEVVHTKRVFWHRCNGVVPDNLRVVNP